MNLKKLLAGPKFFGVVLPLLVFALALFLRTYDLASYPPGLYPDEAANTTDAFTALSGKPSLYYPNNNGREGLFMNLIAVSFALFSANIYSLRIVPALIGFFTVIAVYFLGKELYGKRAGLIASFLVTVSFWHLNFSRIAFRAIMVPLVLAWGVYLLFRARRSLLNNRSKTNRAGLLFLLAGAVFGLGFHTYIAFRIAPAVFILWFLLALLLRPQVKGEAKKIFIAGLIFLGGFLLTLSPMVFYFAKHPEHLGARQNDNSISVMDPRNNQGHLVLSVAKTFGQTMGQFFIKGDQNWRHNLPSNPELSPFVSVMFIFGLFRLAFLFLRGLFHQFKKPKEKEEIFKAGVLLGWFFVMLAPAFLTVEGLPHALRSIGSLVPAYLLAASAIALIWESPCCILKDPKKSELMCHFRKIILGSALALTLLYDTSSYFLVWGKSTQAAHAFERRLVNIGNYLNQRTETDPVYLIVNQDSKKIDTGWPVSLETIRFLAHYRLSEITFVAPNQLPDFRSKKSSYSIILQKRDDSIEGELLEKLPLEKEIKNITPLLAGTEFEVLKKK
jgi:4-amino-4-deoxy-L-arabinose transferase-like glycosyltransferase